MSRLRAALAAVLFLFVCAPAYAATTGLVHGVVTFAGKPQAGASVQLEGEGSRFATTTDRRGAYSFPGVPFGHYHVIVRYDGARARTIDIDVASDAVATVDVNLDQLKEIANTTVTAHAGVGGTPVSVNAISKAQIATSPNRDSLNKLIATVPGIVRFSYNEPVAHGFHGLTYEVDGAPLPQATSSNFAELIDPKNVDSLEVLTGAFPAEYGGSRQGAVVNVVTTRLSDVKPGSYGHLSFGAGTDGAATGSVNEIARFANTELFFNANTQHTERGIDAPTYKPIHDNASQSDIFFRAITQLSPRSTLAFDASNQLAQFAIPINVDPNNPLDPNVSPIGTDDVQREYDRYASLNLTTASRDGNGVFSVIPWVRFTRIAYDGDLANDVQPTQIGLRQDRRANYAGLRLSQFRASATHAWKIGLDASREVFHGSQLFACYAPDCNIAPSTPPPAPPSPGYYTVPSTQDQAGTQVGIYAQDKWQPSRNLAVNYGVRYDHSTGYVGGWQLSPRIGINLSDGGKNIFHAYYGRFYAAPQLEDVRNACVLLNGCAGGVQYTLNPERDAYYEMGVSHTFRGHLKGYVNIFRRTAVNVLDTTQFLNTPLFAVFNNATGIDSGVEARLENQTHDGDSWYISGTVSGAYAGGVSGSTFLFPPDVNQGLPITSPALLGPEDHDQTVAAVGSYTHVFGADRSWFGTLQANYGTGYPVSFQNASTTLSGRLPTHLTFDMAFGKQATANGIGVNLDISNVLNHQYAIKVANGFNTTQIAQGRAVMLRISAPF